MPIGTPVDLGTANVAIGSTSVTLTTEAAVPAGASIMVGAMVNGSQSIVSVTDSAGNTYTSDADRLATRRVAIWSCHNATALPLGGSITMTISSSLSSSKLVTAVAVTGLAAASTKDKSSTNDGNSTTWSTGSTGTLSQANEFAFAVAASGSGSANSPDAGWTEYEDFSFTASRRWAVQAQTTSATTALNAGGTWGSAIWNAALVTYKEASGAASVAADTASATASGDTVAVLAGATVDAGAAGATADGATAVVTGAAGVAAGSAPASADGDAVAVTAGAVVDVGAADATASGGTAAALTGATTLAGSAEATASGDNVVIEAGFSEAASPGDATAGGDAVVITGAAVIAADPAEGTASGDSVVVDAAPPSYVRSFAGGGDKITTALGAVVDPLGEGTLIVLHRVGSDSGTARVMLQVGDSTGSARYGLQINGSGGALTLRSGAAVISAPTLKALAADGWLLQAVSKGAGATPAQFHEYDYDAGVFTHEETAGTIGDSLAPTGSMTIGALPSGSFGYVGVMRLVAILDYELTVEQFRTLVYGEDRWLALDPVALAVIPLDQASVGTPVEDLVGTSDQTAISGTTVAEEDVPWLDESHLFPDPATATAGGDDVDILVGGVLIPVEGGGPLTGTSFLTGGGEVFHLGVEVPGGGPLNGSSVLTGGGAVLSPYVPPPPGAGRSANRLYDPVTETAYDWPINHSEEEALAFARQYQAGARTTVGLSRQQSAPDPPRHNLRGTILEPAEKDALTALYEACDDRTLVFTDYAGDVYNVVIVSWDVRPERAHNPRTRGLFIWRFTMELEILSVESGPLAATGVIP